MCMHGALIAWKCFQSSLPPFGCFQPCQWPLSRSPITTLSVCHSQCCLTQGPCHQCPMGNACPMVHSSAHPHLTTQTCSNPQGTGNTWKSCLLWGFSGISPGPLQADFGWLSRYPERSTFSGYPAKKADTEGSLFLVFPSATLWQKRLYQCVCAFVCVCV